MFKLSFRIALSRYFISLAFIMDSINKKNIYFLTIYKNNIKSLLIISRKHFGYIVFKLI